MKARWLACVMGVSALAGCATLPAASQADPLAGVGTRVLQQYMRPATQGLQASTTRLDAAIASYCARPDAATRAQAEARLADTVTAWARIEFLRFGPLVEQNRLEQFYFWPDPRGVVQRQMRTVLAQADAALLTMPRLRAQSVAVQGIPALEYALYADDALRAIAAGDAAGRYRCAYAAAIAGNLVRLAGEMRAGWEPKATLAREFAAPDATHAVYRSHAEVATEVLKALSTALHVARDQKLLPALGADAASARGTQLPLYRSGLSAAYVAAGVKGLADFYAASALGAALPPDSQWVDGSLRDELGRVEADLAALQMPAERAVADEDKRELLVHATLLLANARAIVDEYLATALNVNLGFNSLDGD